MADEMSKVRVGSSESEYSASERLRAMLDERGIEHFDHENGEPLRKIEKAGEDPATSWQIDGMSYCAVPDRHGTFDVWIDHVTPEQAIAATVGDSKKSDPRNYKPNGEPKIPNMPVGASSDWVDWVASLEHREPSDLTEAVKQLMFEVICFGGDMGPNGNVCEGIDEGMVLTNDFIDGWAKRITATVGNRTDLAKRLSEVTGLHAFAELFGFDWADDSDWTWHDVACAMADAIDAATIGRSCASCSEMDNPDSYISHLQSALRWHDEHVPRPTNPLASCVVLQGKKPPEEVLFVAEGGGVTHYLPEDAGTCEWCKDGKTFDRQTVMMTNHGWEKIRHCPNCGRRLKESGR